MSNLKSNIIIIDDSEFKRNDIKEYIKKINPDAKIIEFDNYTDAMRNITMTETYKNIQTNPESYILFLDMMFPVHPHAAIKRDTGIYVLTELNRKNIAIKTVLISSDPREDLSDLQTKYPFLSGQIVHNPSVYHLKEYTQAMQIDPKP